jgi:quercetin dioxygenase-like cupin family protein
MKRRMASTPPMAGADAVGEQRVTTLVTGEETGGRLALLELIVVKGQEPPCHVHGDEDETVYVREGELTFFVDDMAYRTAAGTCRFLPRGVEHAYAVESGEARLLVVLTPAGLEGAFEELTAGDAGPDLDRLITVAARYGVTITGPAPRQGSRKLAPQASPPKTSTKA